MNEDKIESLEGTMELEEAIKFLENMNNTIKENKLLFDENNINRRGT